jgi:protein subunit release factor A
MFNLDRLETLSKRFDEIEAELANSGGAFDQARFTALVKERAANEPTVASYRSYRKLLAEIASNEEHARCASASANSKPSSRN